MGAPGPTSTPDPTSATLRKVAKGRLCAGCGGCALVAPDAIAMQMEAPGFLRPVQTAPVTADQERQIAALCPGVGQTVEPQGRADPVLWGPYVETRVGWSTDADLRHKASSGGALSALLQHLLAEGAVDGVIQTAAGDPPVANTIVLSDSAPQVTQAAGSRYAPSAPLAGLAPHLEGDKRYAFVGKPCDVAAMRALARLDPRIDAHFPYLVSFFCGGVPSQSAAEELLDVMGAPREEVRAFRYRGMGWPGYATATLADGSERQMRYADSWGQVLSKTVQLRCKICADGTGTAADIVCADAWEADAAGYPLFDEAPGISLIMARTDKGQQLMQEAEAKNRIETQPFDMESLPQIQPGQTKRREAVLARIAAMRLAGRPIPAYRGLHLRAAARRIPLRRHVQSFAGMLSRIMRGRV